MVGVCLPSRFYGDDKKGIKMSTDQTDPSSDEQVSPEEASELLISMSYEAITYLDRAIPEYEKIAKNLENSETSLEAIGELGKAEDGLKWLALYAHQCIESGKEVLSSDIREKFIPFKNNLLPAVRQIIGELEKVDKSALPQVITEHMLPLFGELHVAAKDALAHLGKNYQNEDADKA